MLSDRDSRLAERGSPKRGRDEIWRVPLLNPRPSGDLCVCCATLGLAQARRARPSEMTRYNHCYTLTQVRWASLSETKVLAWAN